MSRRARTCNRCPRKNTRHPVPLREVAGAARCSIPWVYFKVQRFGFPGMLSYFVYTGRLSVDAWRGFVLRCPPAPPPIESRLPVGAPSKEAPSSHA